MASTSIITYNIFGVVTSGLFIPLILSIVSVAWVVGLAIKAMRSNDLV